MKLLAHVCCAPCWLACAPAWDDLVGPDGRWQAFFYNPNVQPFVEFRRRLKACRVLAHDLNLPLVFDAEYGLSRFLDEVDWRRTNRCPDCYRLRLRETAERARRDGFDHFTTTLLASAQQSREAIVAIGRKLAEETGVAFLEGDWRALAADGHEEARRRSIYRQQYCGCVFSEHERYRDTAVHLYREPGGGPE
jgi:predicted adenine nucleotide alpha hydrolase (AANH) superfamily ATPase